MISTSFWGADGKLISAEEFVCSMYRPQDGARVTLDDMRDCYHEWCTENGFNPLPDDQFGLAVCTVLFKAGMKIEGDGQDESVVGIALARGFKAKVQGDEVRQALRVIDHDKPGSRAQRRLGPMTPEFAKTGTDN